MTCFRLLLLLYPKKLLGPTWFHGVCHAAGGGPKTRAVAPGMRPKICLMLGRKRRHGVDRPCREPLQRSSADSRDARRFPAAVCAAVVAGATCSARYTRGSRRCASKKTVARRAEDLDSAETEMGFLNKVFLYREELEKEILAAEETVQALRHALLRAELRLKGLRQRRADARDERRQDAGLSLGSFLPSTTSKVGFGQLRGWLAQQSVNLLQQAEAAGEQEAQLRQQRQRRLEKQSEEQMQRAADQASERVVRQHVLDFFDRLAAQEDSQELAANATEAGEAAAQSEQLFLRWLRDFHSEYDETWFEQNLMRIDLAFRHMFEAHGGMNHNWRILCHDRRSMLKGARNLRSHMTGQPWQLWNLLAAGPTDGDDKSPRATTAPLILIVLAILYGGNVPLLKTVEVEAPLQLTGPELLALRFVSSTVISLPFLVTNWRKVGALLVPSTELAIWLFSGYALQILGLEKTSASTCAVASALTGPFVQILEFVVDGKQFTPFVALCSAGTFAGIALFVSAPSLAEAQKNLFERFWNILKMIAPQAGPMPHEAILKGVPGEALAITGAFLFAVHVYRSNRLIEKGDLTGRVSDNDFAVGLAAVQLAVAAVICIVASAIDSPYSPAEQLRIAERLRPEIWEEILACGVLCTGLPAVVELFAFNYVGPAVASLIYCTIPLWGTFLSVIFLNEKLGLQAIIAAAIILLCSFAPSLRELATESEE
eukprot:s1710_g2.t2